MAQATLHLFTSPTCPHCPSAKAIARNVSKERDDVTLKEIISGTPGSEAQFKRFGITSVPTFIITGPGYPNNIGLRGGQSPTTLNKYIDLALGISKKQETSSSEKKGVVQRMKSLFSKND